MTGIQGYGLCKCGCGELTAIATMSYAPFRWVKGEPKHFIKGHQRRTSPVEYLVDAETGCWIWQRSKNRHGYGRRRVNGREISAHRYAYEQAFGPIPDGYDVHHTCEDRACVNPDHLEALTRLEHNRAHVQRPVLVA